MVSLKEKLRLFHLPSASRPGLSGSLFLVYFDRFISQASLVSNFWICRTAPTQNHQTLDLFSTYFCLCLTADPVTQNTSPVTSSLTRTCSDMDSRTGFWSCHVKFSSVQCYLHKHAATVGRKNYVGEAGSWRGGCLPWLVGGEQRKRARNWVRLGLVLTGWTQKNTTEENPKTTTNWQICMWLHLFLHVIPLFPHLPPLKTKLSPFDVFSKHRL